MVCQQGCHSKCGVGTKLPLAQFKIRLAKLSGLDKETPVIEHVRCINRLEIRMPSNSVCDKHLKKVTENSAKNNPKNNPKNNAKRSAKRSANLVDIKRAAAQELALTGGLDPFLLP